MSIIIGIVLSVTMMLFIWCSLIISSRCSRIEEMEEKKMIDERKIEELKNKYKIGTEIELINMEDPCAVPSGSKGKVFYVDDEGQIHVEL